MNRQPRILLPVTLGAALLMAGCISGQSASSHAHDHGQSQDTPEVTLIEPGATTSLTFDHQGAHTIHCHPHPFMEQLVTVTDAPASEVHVHIFDGPEQSDYRFEPSAIEIGAGSTVVYHNHGAVDHSATAGHA